MAMCPAENCFVCRLSSRLIQCSLAGGGGGGVGGEAPSLQSQL